MMKNVMFCRKNKKYYFAKKWGSPGVDGPAMQMKSKLYL